MYRLLFILLALSIPSGLFAAELVRYPADDRSFQERLKWAFDAASAEKSFWIGYSVQRLMYPNQIFISGVSIHGNFFRKKEPTLQEWIYGIRIEQPKDVKEAARAELESVENKDRTKVWKEMGIFHKFQRGSQVPERIQTMNLTISCDFDAPLYWLGGVTHEESFAYLSGLYGKIADPEQKEDLLSGIGIHPPPIAFPFLKKILTSNEPEQAQEPAAILVGELGTPEALRLLREVAEKNSNENVRESAVVGIGEMKSEAALQTLSEIARSHHDHELRETAMAMLSERKGRATKILEEIAWFDPDEDMRETAVAMLGETEEGVPALLKIMESHPSAETRETAVHILAETVAGREVLKKKIKE